MQKQSPETTAKLPGPFEADVTFSDGTAHRVTGLMAVEYHKNPAEVGPRLEITLLRLHIKMLRNFVADAVTWDASSEWVDAAKRELANTEKLQ